MFRPGILSRKTGPSFFRFSAMNFGRLPERNDFDVIMSHMLTPGIGRRLAARMLGGGR